MPRVEFDPEQKIYYISSATKWDFDQVDIEAKDFDCLQSYYGGVFHYHHFKYYFLNRSDAERCLDDFVNNIFDRNILKQGFYKVEIFPAPNKYGIACSDSTINIENEHWYFYTPDKLFKIFKNLTSQQYIYEIFDGRVHSGKVHQFYGTKKIINKALPLLNELLIMKKLTQ